MFFTELLGNPFMPMLEKDDGKNASLAALYNSDSDDDDDDIDIEELLKGENEDDDDDDSLSKDNESSKDEDDEEFEDEIKEKAKKPGSKDTEEKPKKSGKVEFTEEQQREIDRIVNERLARDRQARESESQRQAQEAQRIKELEKWAINRFEYHKKDLIETYGIDEEKAEEKAKDLVASEYKSWQLEQEIARLKEHPEISRKQTQYSADRTNAINKNPIIAKYIEDIDQVSDMGRNMTFEVAASFVLGSKVLKGELTQAVASAAEQRAIKNINQRKNLKLEAGDAGGGNATGSYGLTRDELKVCKALGISPKQYAKNKKK